RVRVSEASFGFNPGYGIARLHYVVACVHARDLILTGRTIHATEALRMGLVNRVVAPPTLEASVATLAGDIARSPRGGLAATKESVAAIRAGGRGREAEGYSQALSTSPAAREGIRDFASRKKR